MTTTSKRPKPAAPDLDDLIAQTAVQPRPTSSASPARPSAYSPTRGCAPSSSRAPPGRARPSWDSSSPGPSRSVSASASAGSPCAATCSTRPAPRTRTSASASAPPSSPCSTRSRQPGSTCSWWTRRSTTAPAAWPTCTSSSGRASSSACRRRPSAATASSSASTRVLQDAGIQSLIQDGYLSPYHHFTLPAYSPRSVVEHYLRERRRWGRSILYFHTLEQCFAANALLKKAGVRCDVVTGSSDRDGQLEAFRAGRLDVLSNCMVLSEGFDCPELQTVFCRPSCKGVTIQMCGRVLRKHPAVPFKQIVQCRQTRWPFVRTAAAAAQFTWQDDEWRSLHAQSADQRGGRPGHAGTGQDPGGTARLPGADRRAPRRALPRPALGPAPRAARPAVPREFPGKNHLPSCGTRPSRGMTSPFGAQDFQRIKESTMSQQFEYGSARIKDLSVRTRSISAARRRSARWSSTAGR